MLNDSFLNTLNLSQFVLGIFHFAFSLASIVYIVFAIVVVRQIAVMKKTLITSFSPIITILGFAHLGFAFVVALFFILSL